MKERHKLDFSKLVFSDVVISYDEALKDVTPLKLPENVVSGKESMNITKAEKDYENKCVKLEISY